jgi:hypothetical protein
MTVGEMIAGLSHFSPDTKLVISSPEVATSDFDIKVDIVDGRPNCVQIIIEPVK